jgi:hypothetical protein
MMCQRESGLAVGSRFAPGKKQIPFGNDNKKSKDNSNSNSNSNGNGNDKSNSLNYAVAS